MARRDQINDKGSPTAGDGSSSKQATSDLNFSPFDDENDEGRPTAVPPDAFYENVIRETTNSGLNRPQSPREGYDDTPEIEVAQDEQEVDIPVLASRISGSQDIPIDLDFDLDNLPPPAAVQAESTPPAPRSERPTTPRLDLDLPEDMRHPPARPPTWPESKTAKSRPSNSTLEALRRAHSEQSEARKTDDAHELAPNSSSEPEQKQSQATDLELALDTVLGSALDLVSEHLSSPPIGDEPGTSPDVQQDSRMQLLRDKFDLGDYTGAHELADELLTEDSGNQEARRIRDNCREVLVQMYSSRLGSLVRIPRVIVSPDDMRWLSLDHRAGFLLACIDGSSSIDEIMDVSGMSNIETLRILFQLLQQQVIELS